MVEQSHGILHWRNHQKSFDLLITITICTHIFRIMHDVLGIIKYIRKLIPGGLNN